jgi:hypothetical protein
MNMLKTRILAVLFSFWGMAYLVTAQVLDTNRFPLLIKPPPGTNLVSESTNLFSLRISNYLVAVLATTNDAEGVEITVTNMVPVLSNVTVYVTCPTNFPLTGSNVVRVDFNDVGSPPDGTNMDGIFSGNVITPYTQTGVMLPIKFYMHGIDKSITNELGEALESVFTNEFTVQYLLIPRPPNDKFTNAFKMPSNGGIWVTTNNYASIEVGEPKHAKNNTMDASIWWMWSSPVTTNVLIDTAGSSFNTVLGVYTGTNVAKLTEVGSSAGDTLNKLKAYVKFDVVAGVTYRIAVAGKDNTTNSQGTVRLRIAPGASPDTHPPSVSIESPNRETFTTEDIITLTGIAKEPFLNDSGISNVLVQVNNGPITNAVGSDTWYTTVVLPPGTNVIRAYAIDYAGNQGAADSIVVRYVNPTNDLFVSSGWLAGVGGLANANNQRATIEADEPLHAGNVGGHSIWYSWRAPQDGELRLTTSGSTFDTLLDLYVGTNLVSLIDVINNDDAYEGAKYSELVYGVVSNQLYYISVDGYGGESGTVYLQYAFVPPTPGQFFSLSTAASPGGRVSPPSGSYRSGARATLTAIPDINFEFSGWEGDVQSLNNPLTLQMMQNYTVRGTFRLISNTNAPVTDGFETGNFKQLAWQFPSGSYWIVQTNDISRGKYAARSGPTADSQTNAMTLRVKCLAGSGAFDLKTSSELGWDNLEFRLNGKILQRWSGVTAWTNFVFDVPIGSNTLVWVYSKDSNFTEADDAVFIDNVFLPLDTSVPPGSPADMQISVRSNGQIQITIVGDPDLRYTIEASPDLFNWLPIFSGSSASGILQFTDTDAPIYDNRYYRSTTP